MMNEQELEAIRARLAAATPGPWQADGSFIKTPTNDPASVYDFYTVAHAEMGPDDAELIAHAPADLAKLLAEVDRWRTLGQELVGLEDVWVGNDDWGGWGYDLGEVKRIKEQAEKLLAGREASDGA